MKTGHRPAMVKIELTPKIKAMCICDFDEYQWKIVVEVLVIGVLYYEYTCTTYAKGSCYFPDGPKNCIEILDVVFKVVRM